MKASTYINRQGRVHSVTPTIQVPDLESRGADLMSRGSPLPDEWRLHLSVMEQDWTRFGRAEVNLFATIPVDHFGFSLAEQDNSPMVLGDDPHAGR